MEKYFTEMKAKRSREMLFVNVAEVVLYFEEKKLMLSLTPQSSQMLFHAIKIEELSLGRQLSLVLVLEISGLKFNPAQPHKNAWHGGRNLISQGCEGRKVYGAYWPPPFLE